MYNNLVEMIETSCKRYWWRKAILSEDRTIRYYRLKREIDQFASLLINKYGIKPQDRIAILLGNSGIYPVAFFGVLKSGAVVVPLNVFLKGEEVKYIIENCGTRLVITSMEFSNVLEGIAVDKLFVEDKMGPFVEFSQESPHSNSTAVIIYTSGTTGRPKGAMLSHENLLSNIESCVAVSRLCKRDRVLCVLPMFHSFTMTVCVLMPLSVGAGIVIASSLHQFKKVFRRIILLGVTILVGIPPLYSALAKVRVPWFVRLLFKRVRLCISGAAPLPESVLMEFEKKWGILLLEGYGLSEASPVVSLNPIGGKRKPNSVGMPIPGVEVKVVGPDEAELSPGEIGEIIVRGKNVMKGYYNDPQSTAETIRGGWLFTGDLGKIDEEGYIYIVDRKKDMILVRGLNVYPKEIEQVLQEYPGISEVSVVGRPDPNKGEVPVAFIIPKDGFRLEPTEIIKYCRQRLADYKVPREIIVKRELPRTPTGKVLKRELRKMLS